MNEKVEEQYTKWVYPEPVLDMQKAISDGSYWEIGNPNLYWPLFWPYKRSVDEPLVILSAGCGTNQAAYYACQNPRWTVYGIDLSDTSLQHQSYLKSKHNLNNLILKKMNLCDINSLGIKFDFITCTGVLHHLAKPDEGLLALSRVLKPSGVINLMVYGASLRLGVYILQEAFRILGLKQEKSDVDIIRSTLSTLSPDHAIQRYIKNASDLAHDAGIVDTFLHPQDRSYYAKEIFQFTRRAGLEFLNWCDPFDYSLDGNLAPDHPLRSKIADLAAEEQAHVCDLLLQARGTHRWFAGHPNHKKRIEIHFDNDALFDCIISPHRSVKAIEIGDFDTKRDTECIRGHVNFKVDYRLAEAIKRSNGQRSLREVIKTMGKTEQEKVSISELICVEAERLYNLGHIYIIKPTNT